MTIPDKKTGIKRTFTVTNADFVKLYRKYADNRPKHVAHRLVSILFFVTSVNTGFV
jgi:hypothetical protein